MHAAPASDSGKWFKAEKPIKDAQGRIRYIVMLEADNTAKSTESFKDVKAALDWKAARNNEYIAELVKSKGDDLTIIFTTSLVIPSFLAYLTETQAKHIANDVRVISMTQDRTLFTSAMWTNSIDPSGQIRSWGLAAMNNTNPAPSNGRATVYVIDLGAQAHPDLPTIYPGNQFNGNDMWYEDFVIGGSTGATHNVVGCWPHATHVAGIIGAQNNFFGTVGMVPGVKIVSIATGEQNYYDSHPNYTTAGGALGDCSGGMPNTEGTGLGAATLSAVHQALVYTYRETALSGKTAIVNMSLNGINGTYAYNSGTASLMKAVATPDWINIGVVADPSHYYPGNLIVQSAGNLNDLACSYAYSASADGTPGWADGIIVVGGLNDSGQRVTPANGGYNNVPVAGYQYGSNHGTCVEMWAPSQKIISTWKNNTHIELSGTSMAAPYVAGFAARLLEQSPKSSPYTAQTLELAIKAKLVDAGSGLFMPRF